MPEDNKPLSKPFKLQLQFCCRMALISHDMAGSEPLPWLATGLWVSEARGHLPPLLNKLLLPDYAEQGPSPNTSSLVGQVATSVDEQ